MTTRRGIFGLFAAAAAATTLPVPRFASGGMVAGESTLIGELVSDYVVPRRAYDELKLMTAFPPEVLAKFRLRFEAAEDAAFLTGDRIGITD